MEYVPEHYTFSAGDIAGSVTGLWLDPGDARFVLVLAHGAGAGMTHPFMEKLAAALADLKIATFRFNFPYMEQRRGRPGSAREACQTILAAAANANLISGGLPLFIGGKSYGGRMASQLAAGQNIYGLQGLVFYGFPLHPSGKEETKRANHLGGIRVPMLFLQGTRDKLARTELIKSVCSRYDLALLKFFEGADHSFKTLKSTGVGQDEMILQLAEATLFFATNILKRQEG